MAGERTRRFTRSLLRPGQAAELRHSAASAAAVAVSSRQQQRVSVARPPRLPARPGAPGPASPSPRRAPTPDPSRAPSARQRHRRFPAKGALGGPGTLERSVGEDACGFGGAGEPAGMPPQSPRRQVVGVKINAGGNGERVGTALR
uniref:Uncharacterized protein n=1 Tax=Lynx canadensis TaxID=61383 RepID=A0A667HS31_LYNCA